jgi:hypothetical protein
MKNKETILKELSQAQYSISIAVSWLTDSDLINVLKIKAEEGIIIKIVLSKSDWNHLRYFDFKELIDSGSIINKRGSKKAGDGSFMHCKFCIIDEATVLHGSYNWTKNASINDENLAIDKDYEVARKFNKNFHNLLKDSENYLNELDDESIKELIPMLNEKEVNGFDPETELLDLNIDAPLVKTDQKIVKIEEKCTNIASLKSWEFTNKPAVIKEISCHLYDIQEIQIQHYFSITIGDSTARIGCRIHENLLLKSLLTNSNFKVIYSTLDGIPEILVSMLLSDMDGLSIYGPMKFKLHNNTNYFEIIDNGRNKAFYLSSYEPFQYKPNQSEIFRQGCSIMLRIIKGDMDEKEFRGRFKRINWWLK